MLLVVVSLLTTAAVAGTVRAIVTDGSRRVPVR